MNVVDILYSEDLYISKLVCDEIFESPVACNRLRLLFWKVCRS